MPLTNKQYDAIMSEYDRKQFEAARLQRARTDEIYARLPRVREIDESISSSSFMEAQRLIDGDRAALSELKTKLKELKAEKELLLTGHGYPADYLEMQYSCPDCHDRGYIGQKKCHCFRQAEIRLLYSSSHLEQMLDRENFGTLSMDVYDGQQREAMPAVIRACKGFAENFGREDKSLLMYGPVGTGKTFLSHCIAKELLDRGYSVIYFTAFRLFEQLSRGQEGGNVREHLDALLESDLLILDDLGTELANSFTVSYLFQILNERALRRKATIISTNLSLKDFRDVYSERIFSRITSLYTLLSFCGGDIRIRQKLRNTLDDR